MSRHVSGRVVGRRPWTGVALCVLVLTGCLGRGDPPAMPEKIIGELGLGPGQFSKPRAIAAAPDGRIFVIDMTARVQRFSPDGEFELLWQMPEWEAGRPTGVDVDAHGRVLVADTHYHRVMIFDRDGNELGRFGSIGEGPGEFILTTGVAVDARGRLYVGEYGGNDRISCFSPGFEFLYSFGGLDAGNASLLRPQSLVVDEDGTLWVADAIHHRICRFSPEGELLFTFGSPGSGPGELRYPYDVALGPDGRLLVCEFGNNRIQWFDREGNSLGMWGETGRAPGQLAQPWSIAVGKGGRVYVVDSLGHRVQMFRM